MPIRTSAAWLCPDVLQTVKQMRASSQAGEVFQEERHILELSLPLHSAWRVRHVPVRTVPAERELGAYGIAGTVETCRSHGVGLLSRNQETGGTCLNLQPGAGG